jgi:segregation and condensation protein A
VRQLLEYKRFKDAARTLGHAADERAKRYVRKPGPLPKELQGVALEEAQVWDLLGAFNQVMTAIGRAPSVHQVRYDDIPVELHAAEIVAILEQEGPTTFTGLFEDPNDRGHVVGRFLALLELIRAHRVRAEQASSFATIYLFLLEEVPVDDDMDDENVRAVDNATAPREDGAADDSPDDPADPEPEETP